MGYLPQTVKLYILAQAAHVEENLKQTSFFLRIKLSYFYDFCCR